MLAAVDFDNQPWLKADEIKNKALKGRLSPKLEVREAMIPQKFPHACFGIGRLPTHLLCEVADPFCGWPMVRRLWHEPLIRRFAPPSPTRGEGRRKSLHIRRFRDRAHRVAFAQEGA